MIEVIPFICSDVISGGWRAPGALDPPAAAGVPKRIGPRIWDLSGAQGRNGVTILLWTKKGPGAKLPGMRRHSKTPRRSKHVSRRAAPKRQLQEAAPAPVRRSEPEKVYSRIWP